MSGVEHDPGLYDGQLDHSGDLAPGDEPQESAGHWVLNANLGLGFSVCLNGEKPIMPLSIETPCADAPAAVRTTSAPAAAKVCSTFVIANPSMRLPEHDPVRIGSSP